MERLTDLKRFYELLDKLKLRSGGTLQLKDCHGKMCWAEQGVYFFFEDGEQRTDSGMGQRVIRVGTHAVSIGSKTTLWNRLAQHRGTLNPEGGNHRGSIFRLLVGEALLKREQNLSCPHWGSTKSPTAEAKNGENTVEILVSKHIGQMPLLYLPVYDVSSLLSQRAYIEKNAIALLSNYSKRGNECLDPAAENWLGRFCGEKVRHSGLWNSNHVDAQYDPNFLDVFEQFVKAS